MIVMGFKERNTLSLTPTLSQREREKGGPASVFKACAERFPLPKGEGERRIGIGIQGLRRTVPSPKGEGERRTGTGIQGLRRTVSAQRARGKADRQRCSRLVPNGSRSKGKGKGGSALVFKASAERFPLPPGEG
ncbi:hypothetical protein YA27_02210 [Klebsiella aerogenes]|nr:hypothetical protein YA27_02210 [Klebsiella aerogenes]